MAETQGATAYDSQGTPQPTLKRGCKHPCSPCLVELHQNKSRIMELERELYHSQAMVAWERKCKEELEKRLADRQDWLDQAREELRETRCYKFRVGESKMRPEISTMSAAPADSLDSQEDRPGGILAPPRLAAAPASPSPHFREDRSGGVPGNSNAFSSAAGGILPTSSVGTQLGPGLSLASDSSSHAEEKDEFFADKAAPQFTKHTGISPTDLTVVLAEWEKDFHAAERKATERRLASTTINLNRSSEKEYRIDDLTQAIHVVDAKGEVKLIFTMAQAAERLKAAYKAQAILKAHANMYERFEAPPEWKWHRAVFYEKCKMAATRLSNLHRLGLEDCL